MMRRDDEIEQASWSMSIHDDIPHQTSSQTALTSANPVFIDNQYSDKVAGGTSTSGNRSVARIVACTAITFLVVCFIMVGFSLVMSKDIDQQVRNSNEMLRKHEHRMSSDADIPVTNTTIHS